MAYATTAEFNALGLPALALNGFSGDVEDHLQAASGTVDSYLRGKHALPLTSPYPQEIIQATCSIAAYSVLSIRGFDPEDGANRNVRARYEDAIRFLTAISKGDLNLALDADATPTVHDGRPIVRSKTRNTSRRFRGLGTSTLYEDC